MCIRDRAYKASKNKDFVCVYDYYDALCLWFAVTRCVHGPYTAALHVFIALIFLGCVHVCRRFAVSCFDCDALSCFELWNALSQSSRIRRYVINVTYYYYDWEELGIGTLAKRSGLFWWHLTSCLLFQLQGGVGHENWLDGSACSGKKTGPSTSLCIDQSLSLIHIWRCRRTG